MFTLDVPSDFMRQLLNTNTDQVCDEMLEEAAPILQETMQKEIDANIIHHDLSTGDLVKSINIQKQSHTSVMVCPTGYSKHNFCQYNKRRKMEHVRRYPLPNMAKLLFSEYGTSKQAARPVMPKIMSGCSQEVIDKMQDVYDREVGLQ